MNAGALQPSGRAGFHIWLPTIREKVAPLTFDKFTSQLVDSQFLAPQVEAALSPSSSTKQPSYYLDGEGAAEGVALLLKAIDGLISTANAKPAPSAAQ